MKSKLPIICVVLLAALPLLVFCTVSDHQFLNYDDPDYVTENPLVLGGITSEAVKAAFVSSHAGNWHPLTWISHMADVQMFGLNAGRHHLVNLVIHTLNGLLLFGLLGKMTGALWRSFFVAALFAVHPLHVESVAWISERKDLLSGFFFMLTLLAYVNYAKAGPFWNSGALHAGEEPVANNKSCACGVGWYLAGLLFLALGLMSKPMLVTVPCLMVLLDFWPLKRLAPEDWQNSPGRVVRVLLEKVPFLLLAVASSIVTFIAQRKGGAVADFDVLPIEARAANAVVSYGIYLCKALWPADLAPFYPLPAETPLGSLLVTGMLIVAISAAAVHYLKRAPYFFVGWFWFVGMLVPVIGLIQVGSQAFADRYTYLPLIGIFVVLAWAATDLVQNQRSRALMAVAAGVIILACGWLSYKQAALWSDNLSLFNHALRVTRNNHIAHQNIGIELAFRGKIAEAGEHFAQAAAIRPTFAEAHSNLGLALVLQGKLKEGIEAYRKAIALRLDYEKPHYNLGRALEMNGEVAEAKREYEKTLELNPQFWEANKAAGRLSLLNGDFEDASARLREAALASPNDVEVVILTAQTLIARGKKDSAIEELQQSLVRLGDNTPIQEMLGVLLAESGRIDEGIECLKQVVSAQPTAAAHYKLGLGYVIKGDLRSGAANFREAIRLQKDFALAMNDLAWILATAPDPALRNAEEAVTLATQSCGLANGAEARFWGTLDAAYAESGLFEKAMETAKKARQLAVETGQKEIAEAAGKRIALYQQHRPYRQQ